MTSLKYDDIYSRFYAKVEAFDLIFENTDDEVTAEFMSMWLHSAVAYPYIRRVFKTVELDEVEQVITYEMRYTIDDFTDKEFVLELLATAMTYYWLQPKEKSITNVIQFFGGSEQKWFSESKHLEQIRALMSDTETTIRGMVRDRGYLNNTYLNGGA